MTTTSATGYLVEAVPHGERLDEILGLVRIGLLFKKSQCGRKPDAITNYLASLIRELPKPASFSALLEKLESESARHDAAAGACICTKVNRVHEVSTFFHQKRGEVEMPFGTLRNKFTQAKFMVKPKP